MVSREQFLSSLQDAMKEALIRSAKTLIDQAECITGDIVRNGVSEIYVTIRINNEGSPCMDVTKSYVSL